MWAPLRSPRRGLHLDGALSEPESSRGPALEGLGLDSGFSARLGGACTLTCASSEPESSRGPALESSGLGSGFSARSGGACTLTWASSEPESSRGPALEGGPAWGATQREVTVFWWLARRASSRPPASTSHTLRQPVGGLRSRSQPGFAARVNKYPSGGWPGAPAAARPPACPTPCASQSGV